MDDDREKHAMKKRRSTMIDKEKRLDGYKKGTLENSQITNMFKEKFGLYFFLYSTSRKKYDLNVLKS